MTLRNSRPDYGPQLRLSDEIDETKYRQTGEDFYSKVVRIADALKDDADHFEGFKDILRDMRFLPPEGCRTLWGRKADDSLQLLRLRQDRRQHGQHHAAGQPKLLRQCVEEGASATTSAKSALVVTDQVAREPSSGPVSFMGIYDAICQTIASSGHRRGAQMGVLRIDHPDIEQFITAKNNSDKLTGFNISVGRDG